MAKFYVKEVTNSGPNITPFRRVSRLASGECFNPPEGSRLFFAYERNKQTGKQVNVIGVASYKPADRTLREPSEAGHEDPYYHILSFLFVDPFYQNWGCGSQIVRMLEQDALSRCKRNIRIMSAEKAVRFFLRNRYSTCGEPVQSTCSGSPLFNRLVPMEKVCAPKSSGQRLHKFSREEGQLQANTVANDQKFSLAKEKQKSEEPETVLQWNMSNYEIESFENWDDD